MTGFMYGQTVYSATGQVGQFIGVAPDGGFVVSPGWQDHDGDFFFEGVTVFDDVYTEPPREQLHAEVAALTKMVSALHDECGLLMAQKREAERDQREVLTRLKQHRALTHIDDYIAGRITHFVKSQYGIYTVEAFETAIMSHERYSKSQKMLTLYGDTKGDLQWKLNQYSDGSSASEYLVYPCVSEAEATLLCCSLIREHVARCVADEKESSLSGLIKSAQTFNVPVPEVLLQRRVAIGQRDAKCAIERCEKHLAETRAQYAEFLNN